MKGVKGKKGEKRMDPGSSSLRDFVRGLRCASEGERGEKCGEYQISDFKKKNRTYRTVRTLLPKQRGETCATGGQADLTH